MMLNKQTKLVGAIVTVLVLAGATQAAAKPELKKALFFGSPDNAPEVRVGAENGRWLVLKSPGILYKFNYHVEANRPIKNIAVAGGSLRATAVETNGWFRGLASRQRTAWGSDRAFYLPNSLIGQDSSVVKAACNELLSQGKTTTQRHETFADLNLNAMVTLRVGYKARDEKDFRRNGKTTVKVICEAEPSKIQAPPKPYSIDVKVEQKGETCPKQTDVTAIIKYRVPATARFRFKVDGKLSKLYEIKARKVEPDKPQPVPGGGTYYLVERLKTYHLDPGQTHFRVVVEDGSGKKSDVKTIKIDCPPFKITSASLNYKVAKQVTCPKRVKETTTAIATRPGKAPFVIKTASGLTVHSGTAVFKRKGMKYVAKIKRHNLMMNEFDSDMMADFTDSPANSGWVRLKVPCMEVLSGTLDLRGFEATRCEGEAAFSIRTNIPGKVPYQLDCTNGQSWSGKLEAHETGPDTFIGVGVKRFDVSNNEQVNCALNTRKPLPYKILALKGRKYECHKPTGVSGSDDLAPETPPDPQGSRVPGKVFIDPPRPPRAPDRAVIDPQHPSGNPQVGTAVIDPLRSDNGHGASDATPDYPKKTRADAEADKRRLEELRRKRAEAARKKVGAERKRREAAKKAAELKRKREAAKKAADARRKRQAAEKAAEARRKREAAKRKAAQANKKRKAIKRRRSASTAGARVMRLR